MAIDLVVQTWAANDTPKVSADTCRCTWGTAKPNTSGNTLNRPRAAGLTNGGGRASGKLTKHRTSESLVNLGANPDELRSMT